MGNVVRLTESGAGANVERVPPAQCWIHPKTVVLPSTIDGRGLFATARIRAGEAVSRLGGTVVTHEDLVKRLKARETDESLPYVDSVILAEDLHLVLAPNQSNRFANHSCDPNLWWIDDFTLVARREIEAGEELTNDYATSTGDPEFRMECRCGSPLCRHVVTGVDWRRPELRARYGPHWLPALLKRIQLLEETSRSSATIGSSMKELTIPVADERSLTVYDAGDPDGRPILFHHGTPSSGKPFDPHIAFAHERGIRLISYDRAGYGDSTRHAGRAVVDVVQDVEAIADALALEHFATWGLSGGGPHALATAAGLSDRVVAVAAVASIGPPDRADLELTEGMGEGNILEFGLAGGGEEALRPHLEHEVAGIADLDVPGFIEAMRPFLSDLDALALDGELGTYMLDGVRRSLARSVDGWVDDDLAFLRPWEFELESITAPVLVVQGRQDLMVPWDHGEWLARNLPAAESWLREDEGHLTLFVRVAPAIQEWLFARF